jgi:hypothetical protein
VPSKKKSCDLVHQAIAGPAPDQILDAIRAEYWLPATKRTPRQDAMPPEQATKAQTTKPKRQVKP